MLPADRTEMVRILVGLSTIKPGAKITSEGLDVWWMAMQHWPLTEFKQAAAHLARSSEFMPSPFHFEQLRKAGRPTAGEAWGRAVAAARRGGGTDDRLIERAIAALGGWVVVRMSDEDKLHFLERRFAEHYESIQDANDTREAVPAIADSSWKTRIEGTESISTLLSRFVPPEGNA